MKTVVIGGGLLGLSTAYYLALRGGKVSLVDRREDVGLEGSFGNAALLTPSHSAPFTSRRQLLFLAKTFLKTSSPVRVQPRALWSVFRWGLSSLRYASEERYQRGVALNFRLATYSLKLVEELNRGAGFGSFDYQAAGNLMVFRQFSDLQRAVSEAEQLKALGVRSQALRVDEIADREPAIAPVAHKFAGAIYYENDAHGDSHKFCLLLKKRLTELGVTFFFGSEIRSFHQQNGRVVSVACDRGELRADNFVLAAGSLSKPLSEGLPMDLPIYPVKGYSTTLNTESWANGPKVPVMDGDKHIAVTPLGDRLRVAGIAELAGFDSQIRDKTIREIKAGALALYPNLPTEAITATPNPWFGFRPQSSDGVPIIGATSLANLYLNTGHGTLGWTMALGSGKALADRITDVESEFDLAPYSPLRF